MKKGTITLTLDQDALDSLIEEWLCASGSKFLNEYRIQKIEHKSYPQRHLEITLEPDADFAEVDLDHMKPEVAA